VFQVRFAFFLQAFCIFRCVKTCLFLQNHSFFTVIMNAAKNAMIGFHNKTQCFCKVFAAIDVMVFLFLLIIISQIAAPSPAVW